MTVGSEFNQSWEGNQPPSSLQRSTFDKMPGAGSGLDGIQLPHTLQSMTLGGRLRLKGIQLPDSLQSLTFGYKFNQTLAGIQLPGSLQSLTFGCYFNQSMEGIQLPGTLQSLKFGHLFNQGIQLPSSLRSFTSKFLCVGSVP